MGVRGRSYPPRSDPHGPGRDRGPDPSRLAPGAQLEIVGRLRLEHRQRRLGARDREQVLDLTAGAEDSQRIPRGARVPRHSQQAAEPGRVHEGELSRGRG